MKPVSLAIAPLLTAALLANTGCATVLAGAGSPIEVVVADVPAEQTVIEVKSDRRSDDRVARNLVNYTTHLRRDMAYTVKVSRPGHQTAVVPLQRTLNPWLVADFLPMALGLWVLSQGFTPATAPSGSGIAGGAAAAAANAAGNAAITIMAIGGVGVTAGALGLDFMTNSAWNQSPGQLRVMLEEEKQ
jgi:hypothetical protein